MYLNVALPLRIFVTICHEHKEIRCLWCNDLYTKVKLIEDYTNFHYVITVLKKRCSSMYNSLQYPLTMIELIFCGIFSLYMILFIYYIQTRYVLLGPLQFYPSPSCIFVM